MEKRYYIDKAGKNPLEVITIETKKEFFKELETDLNVKFPETKITLRTTNVLMESPAIKAGKMQLYFNDKLTINYQTLELGKIWESDLNEFYTELSYDEFEQIEIE